jgi:acyl carrier protein
VSEDELRAEVRAALVEALALDPAQLPRVLDVDHVESWDSLGHMVVIETLEARFGQEIGHGVALSLLSEDAILDHLRTRRG